MHGDVYIILKESLKRIPIVGNAMRFYGFIFLTRKWAVDKARFLHRLKQLSPQGGLSTGINGPSMWLLIFPEGTNASKNGRAASKRWSDKSGTPDLRNLLLPRSTGLLLCLTELKDSVEYLYDCTLAYEGIP